MSVITYEADGLSMRSHFHAPPGGGARPGLLVFPEIFGLGDHARGRAERIAAELGYASLACDLHGDGRVIADLEEARALMAPLRENPRRMRARAEAALDALRTRPEVDPGRIAAIGYCFGGTMALELARGGADIAGVVGFHSGLVTAAPEDSCNIRGKILVCIGADDPGIPPDQRAAFEQEMCAAGVDWQLHVYGGVVHSFTNPAADAMGRPEFARYDAAADRRSWATMRDFLAEIFESEPT
jgi:dienelactone hydrolase